MSIMTRARYTLARWLMKAGGLSIVPRWVDTTFLDPTWRALARDGYKRNGAVFACVATLAFDIPEPPLMTYDDGGAMLLRHPLRQLLRRPNPLMAEREFWMYMTTYAGVGGNAYAHMVRNRTGRVVELWPYHAGQIIPVPNTDPNGTWIKRYDYDDGTGVLTPIPAEDIIHIKWPSVDLDQPWIALPPLRAAAQEVDADNEASRYLRALLKNDAMPRIVLTTPVGAFPDDIAVQRMKEQWGERYGGDQRGGVAVLEEGVTIERLSLNMAELAFDALRRVPETRIAAAFRVPPIIAGLNAGMERSTFSNYAEARIAYTQQTLAPLWAAWADEFQIMLGNPFGVEVRHDLSKVAALQEDVDKAWERARKAYLAGGMTRNEYRRIIGQPDDPNGNVYALQGSVALYTPEHMPVLQPATPAMGATTPLLLPPTSEETEQTGEVEQAEQTEQASTPAKLEVKAAYVPPPIDDIAERIARRVRRYLSQQYRAAAEAVRAQSSPKIDFEQLPLDFGDEIAELMRGFYTSLLGVAWREASTTLVIDIAFDLANPAVQETIHDLAVAVRGITEATRDDIRALIAAGAAEGWSGEEVATAIGQLAGIYSQERAMKIAVTEAADAYSRGSIIAWRASGEVDRQQWIAEPDACEVCQGLDGEITALGGVFSNGISHPPAHPFCRCALLPVLRQ